MRSLWILGVGIGVALAASVARADRVDCEPARCAVQDAINMECPCTAATNHGRHVSCVAHVVKRLASDGTGTIPIPKECKGKIKRCAARSVCGKKEGFVTCDFPVTGTCDLEAGFCTDIPDQACTSDAECVIKTRCSIKSSAELCAARGGIVGTSSTCCAACPTAP